MFCCDDTHRSLQDFLLWVLTTTSGKNKWTHDSNERCVVRNRNRNWSHTRAHNRLLKYIARTTGVAQMRSLSLFSGIGGLSIGTPVLYCDNDVRATAVLRARMRDGLLPMAPIHDDITTLSTVPPDVELVVAGFPCQDISCAGIRRGFEGDKSVLFYHVARLVHLSCPQWVYLENVDRITQMPSVWQPVILTMSALGYDCTWCVLGAANVGAPHRRNRWFCLCRKVRTSRSHLVTTIDFPSNRMHKSGYCRNFEYGTTSCAMPKAFEYCPPIVLKHVDGRVSKGIVVSSPLIKRRWATPRCRGGTFAARNLTQRCGTDLATQLRFATTTNEKIKWLAQANADWVDWLMGFPIGWSNPTTTLGPDTCHSPWSREPDIDRLCPTTPLNTQRLHVLGNACTSQQCNFAFDLLMSRYSAPTCTNLIEPLPKKTKQPLHDWAGQCNI